MSEHLREARKVSRIEREKIVAYSLKGWEALKKLDEKLPTLSSIESNKDKEWFERVVPYLKDTELCAYCDKFVRSGNWSRLGRVLEGHAVVTCTAEKCPFKGVLKLNIHSPTVQGCMKCDDKDDCEFYLTDIKPIVDREKK